MMVAAATLHAFSTELLVGSMTFALVSTLLRYAATHLSALERLQTGLDLGAFYAAVFALLCIPLVAITGNAAGDAGASPMLVNKVLLSGLCLGLWIGIVHGRWTWGATLWDSRVKAAVHTTLTCFGYAVAAMLGSIGGLLTRRETVGDILGFWPHFEGAPTVGLGMAVTMALLSLIVLLVVIFVQPRPAAQR